MSPSMENTPSTTISRPRAFRSAVMRRRSSVASLWANLRMRAKDRRAPVDDAGVVLLVEIDRVAAIEQAGDGAEVHLEARREGDRRRLADEPRQLLLQRLVQGEGPVQQPAPRASGAVAVDRLDRGLLHLGMIGEPEVVVGAEHHQRPARRRRPPAPARTRSCGSSSTCPPLARRPRARRARGTCRTRRAARGGTPASGSEGSRAGEPGAGSYPGERGRSEPPRLDVPAAGVPDALRQWMAGDTARSRRKGSLSQSQSGWSMSLTLSRLRAEVVLVSAPQREATSPRNRTDAAGHGDGARAGSPERRDLAHQFAHAHGVAGGERPPAM